MITLYGFGRVHPKVIGETRDLRAQWALEELALPYRLHALDHTGGELDAPAYSLISCFHQVPVIEDEGFVVAESGAVLLYLAEKARKLIPEDFEGRTRVVQWCFAALNTVEWPLMEVALIDAADRPDQERRQEMAEQVRRRFAALERRLDGHEWIASNDFTVADILLANVLRGGRKTKLIDGYPRLKAYYERAHARPAWLRTLSLYAERLGVTVADIR
jgi:glutathione S-transferase